MQLGKRVEAIRKRRSYSLRFYLKTLLFITYVESYCFVCFGVKNRTVGFLNFPPLKQLGTVEKRLVFGYVV